MRFFLTFSSHAKCEEKCEHSAHSIKIDFLRKNVPKTKYGTILKQTFISAYWSVKYDFCTDWKRCSRAFYWSQRGFFCTTIHLFQPRTFRTPKLAVLKPPKSELAFFPHIFLTPKCEEKTLKCEKNVRKISKNVSKMWGKNEHNEGSPILLN